MVTPYDAKFKTMSTCVIRGSADITERNTMASIITVNGNMDDNNITKSKTMSTCVIRGSAGMRYFDDSILKFLQQKKREGFESFEDLSIFVKKFEGNVGIKMAVISSRKDIYRTYQCRYHEDCTYSLTFKRGENHGLFVLQKFNLYHVSCDNNQPQSRNYHVMDLGKKRNVPDGVFGKEIQTWKKNRANGGNGVNHSDTKAANNIDNDADSNLNQHLKNQRNFMMKMSFQLLIPYLQKMEAANPGMVSIYERCNSTKEFIRLFVSPAFSNMSLDFVRKVVSLQAEKLSSKWRGTMYSAKTLSAEDDSFIIATAISEGDEDYMTL